MIYRGTLAGMLLFFILLACTPTGGRFPETLSAGAVSPTSGPTSGNTHITITGKKFGSKTRVVIGGATCLNITIISDTELVCDTPSHDYGLVDIIIVGTEDNGNLVNYTLKDAFEYLPSTPEITSISPQYGSQNGGTIISIYGSNFISGASVTIDNLACENVVVRSSTEITCTTPAHAIGAVDVTVTIYTLSATLTNGFQYQYIPSSFVDGNSATSIINVNYDSGNTGYKNAKSPILLVYRNTLYAIWTECNDLSCNKYQLRMKYYNGDDENPSWSLTEEQTEQNGLNKDSSKKAQNPSAVVFNDELYVAWDEPYVVGQSSYYQIRVARYNPTDTDKWKFVDGDGVNGINKDTSKNASTPQLFIHNNKLYCTWSEINAASKTQIRVAEYNSVGSTWSFIDGGEATGINFSTTQNATYPMGISFNNEIYVAWLEVPSGETFDAVRVKRFTGSSWQVDEGGGTKGLNIASSPAANPNIFIHNDNLYVIWRERASGQSYYQIRIAKRIDIDNWDKSISGSNGLNKVSDYSAYTPFPLSQGTFLYLTWAEDNSVDSIPNVRAAVTNNTNDAAGYLFIDGNTSLGINKNTTKNASTPIITFFNDKMYYGWVEQYWDSYLGRNVDQFRVRIFE